MKSTQDLQIATEKITHLKNVLEVRFDQKEIYEIGLHALAGAYTCKEYSEQERQEMVNAITETVSDSLKSLKRAREFEKWLRQVRPYAPNRARPAMRDFSMPPYLQEMAGGA